MPESQDERARRLEQVAQELACRVRDEPAEANQRWLRAVLPNPDDREALAFVLAVALPVDMPWSHLTRWAQLADVQELVAERFQIKPRRAS